MSDQEGIIPVDMSEFPTSVSPLDESLIYRVVMRRVLRSQKNDKHGDSYFRIDYEVVDGEYKGRSVNDGYIRIPNSMQQLEDKLGRKPTEADIRDNRDRSVRLSQLIVCFKIPYTQKGIDVKDGIGREGNVTIKNEEYPQGSGTIRSRVHAYLDK